MADYESADNVDASDVYQGLEIIGNGNDNSLRGGYGADTLTGGAGADVFIYDGGDELITDYQSGEDTIKLSSAEIVGTKIIGANIILQTGEGELTLKGARGKEITVIDLYDNETTQYYYEDLPTGLPYNSTQVAIMVEPNFKGSTVDITKYAPTAKQVRVSSTVAQNVSIVGNGHSNSLRGGNGHDTLSGGSGNDTLTGGAGADVFIYSIGKDVITDYKEGRDTIRLSSGTISAMNYSGNDVIFTIGNGTLTVKNARGTNISVIDSVVSQSYSRTAELLNSNNFLTNDTSLDSITEQKFAVQNIDTENKFDLAQDSTLLTFNDK